MKFGPHGGWHGHPDKLSITLHDGEREILPDLGSPAYGVPDHKLWYKKTISHNTVTVDGKDQAPSSGHLVRFENRTDGGTIEAVADSAYNNVKMRRIVDLSPLGLKDVFTCQDIQLNMEVLYVSVSAYHFACECQEKEEGRRKIRGKAMPRYGM